MAIWAVTRAVTSRGLRKQWGGLAVLGLITLVWVTATLTAAAGARRTASVVERFKEATVASDATFAIGGDRSGERLLAEVSTHPEVLEADRLWSATTGLAYDDGLFVVLIAGTEGRWGRSFDRPLILRGRSPDPASATEVVVTTSVAELLGIDVGDRLQLPTWARDTWIAWLETRGAYPPFDGPAIDVEIVGVAELAATLGSPDNESLLIIATPALYGAWLAEVGENEASVVASFRSSTDFSAVATQLSARMGEPVGVRSADQAYGDQLRDATRASSLGIVVLAVSIALAGGLVVGFGVGREVRRAAVSYVPLRALGATPLQRVFVLAAPIAAVAVVAAVLAVVLAISFSPIFPLGIGRSAEPTPGVRPDPAVLVASAAFVVLVIALCVVSVLRPARPRFPRVAGRSFPAGLIRNLGPAFLFGHRNAVRSRQSRGTLLVASLTLAGMSASAWFTQSLFDLRASPERWGYTWSSSPDIGVAATDPADAIDRLADHPDVISVGFLDSAVVLLADTSVMVSAFVFESGELVQPRLLEGRFPSGAREIALGERTARELRIAIGDPIVVNSEFTEPETWKVVGLIVPPYQNASAETGVGAYTSIFNFEQLHVPFENAVRVLTIRYRDGVESASLEAELSELGFVFIDRSHPREPLSLSNIVGVSSVLVVLLIFYVLMGALATLLDAARSGSQQARDLLVLRTLGFTRRNAIHTVVVEGMIVLSVGFVIGLPIGLAVARWTWSGTIGDLGIIDTQPAPAIVAFAVAVVGLVGAVCWWLAVSRTAIVRGRSYRSDGQ